MKETERERERGRRKIIKSGKLFTKSESERKKRGETSENNLEKKRNLVRERDGERKRKRTN